MATLVRRMRPLMGCFVEVALPPHAVGEAGLNAAFESAFTSLTKSAATWSFQDPSSVLSRLNSGATVMIDRPTERLLRLARAMTTASSGLFDCTLGGQLVFTGHLPDHSGAPPLLRGHPDDIHIGRGWARLARPVRLTLDGIAKGFAVDVAIDVLKREGDTAGLINAGGDLRTFGPLQALVQRRELDGQLSSLGQLQDAAVATSRIAPPDSDEDDAKTFPARLLGRHLRVPSPGIWTVVAHTAWRADALTKVAAAAEPRSRFAQVKTLGGLLIEPVKETPPRQETVA